MRRSDKKRKRCLEKKRLWALQEATRDIISYRAKNSVPGVFVARGMFTAWKVPWSGFYVSPLVFVMPKEQVVLLDLIPKVEEDVPDTFKSTIICVVMTRKGVGYFTFTKHNGDGGVHSRIGNMLGEHAHC